MQFDFTRALNDGFSKDEIINAFASSMDTDINWQAVDEQYLKQGKSDEFFELLKNPSNYTIYGKKQKEQEPQEIPQNAQLNLQAPLNENAFNAQANLDKTLLKQEEPQTHTLQSPQDLSKWEHLKLAFGAETQAQTQERKAQEAQANTEVKSALKSGVAFDDLSEDLKQKAQLLGKGEISYEQDLRRDELMAKDEQGNYTLKESDLSDDDRELIKKDLGFFNSLFASEKDEFKE
ncbi:hypothetical protein IP360_05100 [Helicobacter winghamensis]|uniref:hypothetical protein n=1 Tax=Helicobacter winghamensis TaxID=157268 RepID=UPI002799C3ED